jgi:hypothetical protein
MMDDREHDRMMQHHTESIMIDSKAKYIRSVIVLLIPVNMVLTKKTTLR